MLGGIKLEEFCRIISEALDKTFDKPTEMMRWANHCKAGLEQEAQQSRLAKKADVPTDTKIRKLMEDIAAERVKS